VIIVKRAVVVAKDIRDFQFYETVTIDSGQNIKLFQDMDEAKKWLLKKERPTEPRLARR
jgi:hypothetical protein